MASLCVQSFAERIGSISRRANEARLRRDMDAELAARNELTVLLEDHDMVQILARAYLLTEAIAFEGMGAIESKPTCD